MHSALAALTRQPVFLLTVVEAKSLTDSLCDVLDYHRINITQGFGPWGLYVALGLSVFSIYKPRLDYIKAGTAQQVEQAAAPATPGEAAMSGLAPGSMDFSGDVAFEQSMMQ